MDVMQNEFMQILGALENLVYKMRREEDGREIVVLSEGKLARELGFSTELIYGKTVFDIYPEETARYISMYHDMAFSGQQVNFELVLGANTYDITLSPIKEEEKISEIVGCSIDITKYKTAEEKIHYISNYDALTELPNKNLLRDRFNIIISHVHRNDTMSAIIMLDLDRFKLINDTLGHETGDMLLVSAGKRLKGIIREDDTVSRFGGDEFVIHLSELESEDYVQKMAQNILQVFSQPFYVAGRELFVTPSLGITLYPHDGRSFEELVKNAEIAMFRAKDEGRNRYHFYTNSMNERALERLGLENFLRKAIEYKELRLLYQPQIDIKTGAIIGAEALVRWNHPNLGIVSPADFVPLAEETGLIVPVGFWVLETACRQNKLWQDMGYGDLKMAVNISARQFTDKGLPEQVEAILKGTRLDPSLLELEITENTIMKNTDLTVLSVNRLKGMGINIAIDDFGTGFSSLSYLTTFKVDILKIDRSFIKALEADANSRAIATAIINMAHNLNLKVVAEGVEELEQLNFLKQEYCDYIQGYYFSRPVTAEEFEEMLKKNRQP